jgi:hypothetical protein
MLQYFFGLFDFQNTLINLRKRVVLAVIHEKR